MDSEFRWILATAMTATLLVALLALGGCAQPVPTTRVDGPSPRLMRPPAALPEAVAGKSATELLAETRAVAVNRGAQVRSLQQYIRVITQR